MSSNSSTGVSWFGAGPVREGVSPPIILKSRAGGSSPPRAAAFSVLAKNDREREPGVEFAQLLSKRKIGVDTAAGVLGVTIAELASILEGNTKGVRANRVQELVAQLRERTKRPSKSDAPENTASG